MWCPNVIRSGPAQGRWQWLLPMLLTVLLIVVFHSALHHDFVTWDDDLHVYANPRFQPVTWKRVEAFWRTPYEHLYIPLTYTVWAGLTWVSRSVADGRLVAGLFHLTNLIVHLTSVLVVYRLGLLILTTTADRQPPQAVEEKTAVAWRIGAAAACGALVFGLHPLQVEAVAWVSGLKDVLYGAWGLIALWHYLAFTSASCRSRQAMHYATATVAFGLALLAKPAAVVVPLLAWILDAYCHGVSWRRTLRALGPWLLVALLWGAWTKGQQPDSLLFHIPSWWTRLWVAADALGFYTEKLLWPVALIPDYGRTPELIAGKVTKAAVGLALLLVGLGAALCVKRQRWSNLRLATALFVAALLPVLGVVPFAFQTYSTVADRYAYLALLGPALGVACAVQRLPERWTWWLVVLALLGTLAMRCADQVHVWRDTVSLFTHTLAMNPHSWLGHNNLGLALARQGAVDEGMGHFQRALRLRHNLPEAQLNLGMAFMLKGQTDTAIRHYTEALRLRPQWAKAHHQLGMALDVQGRYPEAMLSQARALLLRPDWPEAHYHMGRALSQQGRLEDAKIAYRLALRNRPAWAPATVRLVDLLLSPAVVSEAAVAEALRLAEDACSASGPRSPQALYALARAYQAAQRPEAARSTARQALIQAKAIGHQSLIADITSRFPLAIPQEPPYASP